MFKGLISSHELKINKYMGEPRSECRELLAELDHILGKADYMKSAYEVKPARLHSFNIKNVEKSHSMIERGCI
jgi:hypothetical protein